MRFLSLLCVDSRGRECASSLHNTTRYGSCLMHLPTIPSHYGKIVLAAALYLLFGIAHAGSICGCEHHSGLLMDLYNATNGPQWRKNSGWGTTSPCSTDWYGVTCNGGDITHVELPFNILSGTLPATWSNMSSLQGVFLYSNRLSGTLPATWSSLSSLRHLYLDSNSLSGTLPSTWSSMSRLLALYLYSNSLSGPLPASWSSMSLMENLFLDSNSLSGALPASWSSMSSLKKLYLYLNCIDGVVPSAYAALPLSSDGLDICKTYVDINGSIGALGTKMRTDCGPLGSEAPAYCETVKSSSTTSSCALCGRSRSSTDGATSASSEPLGSMTETGDISVSPSGELFVERLREMLGISSAATAVVIYGALVTGAVGAASAAIPPLQRASAAMQLAMYCQDAGGPDDAPFSALADNPLHLALPMELSNLDYTAGAAVGNSLLVCIIGLLFHLVGRAQRRVKLCSVGSGCFVHVLLSVLPSSLLPGSLAFAYATLLLPSIGACVALIVNAERRASSIICGVAVLCLWISLQMYYAWMVLWRGRTSQMTGRLFLLTRGPTSSSPKKRCGQQSCIACCTAPTSALVSAVVDLTTPLSEWTVRQDEEGCPAKRRIAHLMLERLDAVFGAYVERREWFFLVEFGVSAISGALVLGVAGTFAELGEGEEAGCTAARWGMWCAVVCGVAEIALCLWLRPFSVPLEMCIVVVIGVLAVLSEGLALVGETSAAATVVLSASVLELLAMVAMLLIDCARTSRRAKERRLHGHAAATRAHTNEAKVHRSQRVRSASFRGLPQFSRPIDPPTFVPDRGTLLRRLVELACQMNE